MEPSNGLWSRIKHEFFNGATRSRIDNYSGYLYLFALAILFSFQVFQYFQLKDAVVSFMQQGPRFTAQDRTRFV